MAGSETEWAGGQRVAWTERDGPSGPPSVPGWAWVGSATCIGLATVVLVVTDALCPEHRMWVQVLGALATLGAVTSVVGVVRSWSVVPYLVLASSALGVAIGVIDAAHAPVRGAVVMACFVAAMLLGTWMTTRELTARRWASRLRAELETQHEQRAYPGPEATVEVRVESVDREHARRS